MSSSSSSSSSSPSSADLSRLFSAAEWTVFFTKTPCVHASFALGAACAGTMMAHKLLIKRSLGHACFSAALTFTVSSCIQFSVCASELSQKKAMIREAFGKKNIPEAPSQT